MKAQTLLALTMILTLNACKKTEEPITPPPSSTKTEALSQENINFRAYQLLATSPVNVNYSPVVLKNIISQFYVESTKEKKEKIEQIFKFSTPTPQNESFTSSNLIWNKGEIDEWIEKNTCGNLNQALDKTLQKKQARMLGSICFHGKLVSPFAKENTKLAHFQSSPYETNTVKIMHKTDRFKYYEDSSSKWIEMDFQNSSIKLLLALPVKRFELHKIEQKLSAEYFNQIDQGLAEKTVEVAVPPFQLNHLLSMKDLITQAGLDYTFNKNSFEKKSKLAKASFSEITQVAAFNLSETGMNELDENTEIKKTSEKTAFPLITKTFFADQPFLVVLKDSKTNEIILLGREYRP